MSLVKKLREQNYDYIDGPIRNHEVLQVWRKMPLEEAERFYGHISHAFDSEINLPITKSQSLIVNSTVKQEYGLKVGLTVLETLLQSLGLGNLGLNLDFKGSGSVSISYDNAQTRECATGDLINFFSASDFKHQNPLLLNLLNKDRLLVVSGILEASDFSVEIDSSVEFGADLKAEITNLLGVALDINFKNEKSLVMKSAAGKIVPVAVMAHRIMFDHGSFQDLKIVTNNRFFF